MDWEQVLRANGLDRYDRNARLYPAFLVLLPIFVVIALWLPQAWTLLGGLFSLCVGCGLIFYLAQVVRYFGRQVEVQLGDRIGRARSAMLLSHGDSTISADTKARYHKYLGKHGIEVPQREAEIGDPAAARESFRSAVDWLLVHTHTNAKSSLLHNENIAYGFRRNLLGMKPLAIAFLILAMAINGYLIATKSDQSKIAASTVIEFLLLLAISAWVFVVRASFVEDASLAYAQQFFAQCESAKPARRPRKATVSSE